METEVQLLCPDCNADWATPPADLPAPDEDFACDHCDASHRTAEFTRTKRDLRALKQFRS
jgi:hypothetical protein